MNFKNLILIATNLIFFSIGASENQYKNSPEITYRTCNGLCENMRFIPPFFRIRHPFAEPTKTRIIAEDSKGLTVGYAIFENCTLNFLEVIAEHQKKGIGKKLWTKSIKKMMEDKNCEKIEWHSTQTAKEFYQKLGATVDHNDLSHYPKTSYETIKMKKQMEYKKQIKTCPIMDILNKVF